MTANVQENLPFIAVEFAQLAEAGSIDAPGLKVGDTLIALNFAGDVSHPSLSGHGWFEGIVTVDSELQQKAATTDPTAFRALFVRFSPKSEAEPEAEKDVLDTADLIPEHPETPQQPPEGDLK